MGLHSREKQRALEVTDQAVNMAEDQVLMWKMMNQSAAMANFLEEACSGRAVHLSVEVQTEQMWVGMVEADEFQLEEEFGPVHLGQMEEEISDVPLRDKWVLG